MRSVAIERRWRVLDRYGIVESLVRAEGPSENSLLVMPRHIFFDVRHFEPYVYEELNKVLLSML
jgi:hypothetical protein